MARPPFATLRDALITSLRTATSRWSGELARLGAPREARPERDACAEDLARIEARPWR